VLGWEPKVGLREGVEKMVEWYAAERSWAREVLTP
jgi:UDP-glucuronate 4-epimerase